VDVVHLPPRHDRGSVGLFVIVPLLAYAVGGDYALGVYIGTGIAVHWYTVETHYLRRETTRGVENARKANQAGLLKQILEEHANLAEDREVVRKWWQTHRGITINKYPGRHDVFTRNSPSDARVQAEGLSVLSSPPCSMREGHA
jgi:hypothetical protein